MASNADGDAQWDATEALLPSVDPPPAGVCAAWDMRRTFPSILTAILAVLIACFAVFSKYSDSFDTETYYMFFIHVSVMIFVGFGFLMTFLKRYSMSAVSLNFVASCMMMLADILLHGVFTSTFESLQCVSVSVESLIQGLFCAGAGMISFGALLGKASPTQVVLLLLLEVPLYAVNAEFLVGGIFDKLGAQDFGGSIAIHAFGAYYGLAASWVLYKSATKGSGGDHAKNTSSYVSDITAMIGTIFLWVYWPSFNAAIATVDADSEGIGITTSGLRMYAVVNTALSLCGATLSAFAACSFFKGKLDMVLVQNATLAGGVAVGSSTSMLVGSHVLNVTPGGAIAIGAIAGLLSSWGFAFFSPFLEARMGLKDTCGVNNLHGMPGVFGGLVPVLVLLFGGEAKAAAAQAAAVGCTVALAIAGGVFSGVLVGLVGNAKGEELKELMYEDRSTFEVEEEEE